MSPREALAELYPAGVRPWLRHLDDCRPCLDAFQAFEDPAPRLCEEGRRLWDESIAGLVQLGERIRAGRDAAPEPR